MPGLLFRSGGLAGHVPRAPRRAAGLVGVTMPFDPQPTLRGDLLELRPLQAGDFKALYAVASDPWIWEQHPARNRHEEPVFRALFEEFLATRSALVAVDAATRRIIGSSRYYGYDEERSEVEIGWTFLARSHWGGRYNGEMKRMMLRHAFRFVHSVIFVVGVGNLRSQRAVERIGAARAGTTVGRNCESYVYRITAAEFEGREVRRGTAG